MRIGIDCHTVGSRVGGNESYILNLVRALARLDADNEYRLYVTRGIPEVAGLPEAANFTVVRLAPHTPVVRIPISFPIELLRHPVDVLHVQYIPPPVGDTPVANMVHDLSHFEFPQFFPRSEVWRQRLLLPRAIRRAARVLTVSEYCRKAILKRFEVSPERVVVTYPGVSEEFRPASEAAIRAVLAEHGVQEPYLLFVGNIQPRKNLRGLLDAFAELKVGGLPHRLVIVGRSAWAYEGVFRRVEELGLSGEVVFTSYVPSAHLPALYSGAAVLVFPSFFEGFGAPPVEAMSCGTPVVASSGPAFPEILGDAALLVNPADPGDIARGIRTVLQDRDVRDGLVARGYERAGRYRWEDTARRTLAVFEEVAVARTARA